MTTIKQILMGIVGGVVLTTIAKPSNAITFTIGGTTVPGQGQFSSLPGVTTIDFESGAPTSGPIVYSAPGIGPTVVSGSSQGHYSQPSDDFTKYLTVAPLGNTLGNNPVTISSNEQLDYFGMYWGSIDNYNGNSHNSIAFYRGNKLLASFTGIGISGGIPQHSYVNFFAEENESFDRIILSSSLPAFETDNHAYRLASEPEPNTSVPEPTSAIGLLIFGAVAYRLRKGK